MPVCLVYFRKLLPHSLRPCCVTQSGCFPCQHQSSGVFFLAPLLSSACYGFRSLSPASPRGVCVAPDLGHKTECWPRPAPCSSAAAGCWHLQTRLGTTAGPSARCCSSLLPLLPPSLLKSVLCSRPGKVLSPVLRSPQSAEPTHGGSLGGHKKQAELTSTSEPTWCPLEQWHLDVEMAKDLFGAGCGAASGGAAGMKAASNAMGQGCPRGPPELLAAHLQSRPQGRSRPPT